MASLTESVACVAAGSDARQRTMQPIVTGTSVVALKFKGGVLMASDTLGSYGGLARFTECTRIVTAGKQTLVGVDGDLSDFQYLKKVLKELELEDKCVADGNEHSPREVWSCVTRILYHRRSKMNPLWNNVVVAGALDGETFLGTSDKIGTSYEDDFIATGLGLHMAMPILRKRWTPEMSENDALALLEDCMRVLFYRDCRTINRITFSKVTKDGAVVEEARALDTEWSYDSFVKPGFNPY